MAHLAREPAGARAHDERTPSGSAAANIPFVYAPMAKARNDLLLRGHLRQSAYAPGSPMLIVLEPVLYGTPRSGRTSRGDVSAQTASPAPSNSSRSLRGVSRHVQRHLAARRLPDHHPRLGDHATRQQGDAVRGHDRHHLSARWTGYRPGGRGGAGTGDGGGTTGDDCRRLDGDPPRSTRDAPRERRVDLYR